MNPIPSDIAAAMAALVNESDSKVLHPYCGKGELIRHLPLHIDLWAMDNNRRYIQEQIKPGGLMSQRGNYNLQHYHYLGSSMAPEDINAVEGWNGFDVIIGKPPDYYMMDSIERSLLLLNKDNPNARILFLLPLTWNCTKAVAQRWEKMSAHIHHEYRIVGDDYGLVSYKQYGVFDIRPKNNLGAVSFLAIPSLGIKN